MAVLKTIIACLLYFSLTLPAYCQDYFLDSIATISFQPPNSGGFFGTKYFYDEELRVKRIEYFDLTRQYTYGNNTIRIDYNYMTGNGYEFSRILRYNNQEQLVSETTISDNTIIALDSFQYENGLEIVHELYHGIDGELLLQNRKNSSYNDDGLLISELEQEFDLETGEPLLLILMDYFYYPSQLLYKTKRILGDDNYFEADSIVYQYYDDDRLMRKYTTFYSSFSEDYTFEQEYQYKDDLEIEIQKQLGGEFENVLKTKIERYKDPGYDYTYDTILTYDFFTQTDSTLVSSNTKSQEISSDEDSISIRISKKFFFQDNSVFTTVSKKFYVTNPTLVNRNDIQLENWKVYPNPIFRDQEIRIETSDVHYDKIKITTIDGRSIQDIPNKNHGNPIFIPSKKGVYLIQLWRNNQPVSVMKKIVVI